MALGLNPTDTVITFQWTDMAAKSSSGTTNQNINFQISLYQYTSDITVSYGNMSATAGNALAGEVGISGATTSDFNNRTTTTGWLNTAPGVNNTDAVTLSSTVSPPSGFTFLWVAPICFAPLGLTATSVNATSAVLEWTNPIGSPQGAVFSGGGGGGTPGNYDLVYGTGATMNDPANTTVSNVSSPYAISGLVPNTTYNFWVSSVCLYPVGSTWVMGSFTTPASSCVAPTAVNATNITPSSANINWTASATIPANGYDYEVRSSGAAGSGMTGLIASGNTSSTGSIIVPGLSAAMGYTIYVRALCGVGDTSLWAMGNFATPCIPPTLSGTTGASRCGIGSVTLNATGTGNAFYWYNNATTDTVAGMGSSFTTPAISNTTTYYVLNADTSRYTGLGNTQIPTSSGWTIERGIVVQATQSFILNSAQVYSDLTTGTLDGTAKLVDDVTGNVLVTTPFSIPAGSAPQWLTMPLGWNLTAGKTYRLLASFSLGYVRHFNAGADYTTPAFNNLGPLGTILSGYEALPTGPSTTAYSYFHNISATTLCASPRVAVVATVNTASPVNLGNDTTICAGNSLTLDAGNLGAAMYMWSTGGTMTQTITVNTAGTYNVAVTSATGCVDYDTIIVSTFPAPMPMLGNDTAICAGAPLLLDAGGGVSYQWSNGGTNQTINAGSTTVGTAVYAVMVTNAAGCVGRDTINVTTTAAPIVMIGNDTTICDGNNVTLTSNTGASFVWNTGSTTQSIIVNTAGNYSVKVANAAGCVGRDTINVNVSPLPFVNLGRDTALCMGDTLSLSTGVMIGINTFAWSNGATTPDIDVTTPGNYSVMVTNNAGCIGTDAINIMPGLMPVAGTITTNGSSPTFTFTVTGSQNSIMRGFSFGDGAIDTAGSPSTSTHTYTANGTYIVTCYIANPCGIDSVKDTVDVTNAGVNTVTMNGEVMLSPNPATNLRFDSQYQRAGHEAHHCVERRWCCGPRPETAKRSGVKHRPFRSGGGYLHGAY